ncbi:MAG: porin [Pseudomonadota bacterium]
MKKLIATTAVLSTLAAASAGAQAQSSSVTIYGIADAGISSESGGAAGRVNRISSGIASASRLGFRGNEDLGGGWKANFTLEMGYRLDTGEVDAAGTLFNRQAFVGLRNEAYGALSFGRQYTPYYLALSTIADPFGVGYAGSAKNLFPTVGANTRSSNSVVVVSPKLAGFTGELAYAFGEQAGSGSAGRQLGFALGYSAGKLVAKLAHNHRNNDLTAAAGAAQVPPVAAAQRELGRNTLLAANYDFGALKGYLGFGIDKGLNSAVYPAVGAPYGGVRPAATTDSRDLLLGVSVPFGSNTFLASYIAKDDRSAGKRDARQIAVGITHALSKRTSLYSSYGKISNENGAIYTVGNNSDVGTGDRAFNAGVRHAF